MENNPEIIRPRESLFEKIKVCVEFDYVGKSVATVKITKQITRLYDACMLMPDAEEYINDRYADIISHTPISREFHETAY